MTAVDRLLNYYNDGDWDATTNPGGMLDNGHRPNFVQLLRDAAEVAETLIAPTTETGRLANYYGTGDYDAGSNPGGFGAGGHRVNYIPALQDLAEVASDVGIADDAIDRLATYYNANRYNANTNPGGIARGGHRVNFEPSLADVRYAGFLIADFARPSAAGVGTATGRSTSDIVGVAAGVGAASAKSASRGLASGTGTATGVTVAGILDRNGSLIFDRAGSPIVART